MKTQKFTTLVLAVLIVLSNCFMLEAQDEYEGLKTEYRTRIDKSMKKNNIRGASIILVDGDSVVWEEYFGYADVEKEKKIDENTLFKVGSVSKLFTGTGVMMHVQQGKMDLDEPLNKYLPSFKIKQRFNNAPPTTTRMVLTHHAGIPCDILRGFESDSVEPYTKELEYLNEEYTIFEPNKMHAYSNPGFNLLGILAGELAGTSYMEYVRNSIFKPLGMNSSKFWGYDPDSENLSLNYNVKGEAVHEAYIREIPAGSILSNVRDLSKFAIEWQLQNNRETLLKTPYKKEMLKVQNQDNELDMGLKIGLVWFIDEQDKSGAIYNHGGATLFHRAMLAISPETGLSVIILTNSERGNALCYLYDDIINAAAEINGTAKEIEEQPEKEYPQKKIAMSEATAEQYAGIYAFPGGYYELKPKNGKLKTKLQGLKINLLPVDEATFLPKIKLLGFIGIKMRKMRFVIKEIDNHKVVIINDIADKGSSDIFGIKIEKQQVSEAWKQRLGKYEIANNRAGDFVLFDNFELKFVNDFFLFSSQLTIDGKPTLEPVMVVVSDELAYIAGLGRQGGYAVQAKRDNQGNEYLYFSGYKLIKKSLN